MMFKKIISLLGIDKSRIKKDWRETLSNCKVDNVRINKKIGDRTVIKTFLLNNLHPTQYGWIGCCNIPTGLEFASLEKAKGALEDKLGCQIEMKKKIDDKNTTSGVIKFIYNMKAWIKEQLKDYEPVKPPKFGMIFLGYDKDGEPVFLDLMKNPHLLISGETGKGKTVLMCMIMTNIIHYWHDLIDLYLSQIEKSDSYYFSDCKPVRATSYTLQETLVFLKKAEEWMEERKQIFKELNVIDIGQYNEKVNKKIKLKIFIIEEFSFYKPDSADDPDTINLKNACAKIILKINRTGRSYGIHFFSVLQRTVYTNIDTNIRNSCFRISFKQNSEADSENAVGNKKAFNLNDEIFEFYAGGSIDKVLLPPKVDKGFDILRKYVPEIKAPRYDLIEKLNKNELTLSQLISKKDKKKDSTVSQKEKTIDIYEGLTKEEQALLYYQRNGYISNEYRYLIEENEEEIKEKPVVTSARSRTRTRNSRKKAEVAVDANAKG